MSTASEKPVAVGLGEILWDLLPGGKQLGGAPANFAYHAMAQGATGVVASAVGDDALGTEIIQRLDAAALDRSAVFVDRDHPTGTVEVKLDSSGVPEYVIHQGAAWDYLPESAAFFDMAERADIVCFGSLAQRSPVSRQTIRKFLAKTAPTCLRVFDINLRQHYYDSGTIRDSLALSSVFKLNEQELPVVAELLDIRGEEARIARVLFERFPLRLIAVTCGGSGSRLYTRAGMDDHPGYTTEVVDTVGAGDSFTATLALGFMRGEPIDELHDRANRVASYVCSQAGAMPVLRTNLIH